MFEDSTFESAGRIRTRSRRWMVAAFAFNLSILLCFVLAPLIYLEALPPQYICTLIPVPPMPEQQPVQKPIAQTPRLVTNVPVDPFTAPRRIPTGPIYIPPEPEVAISNPGGDGPGIPGGIDNPVFRPQPAPHVVHQPPSGPVRVSTAVEEGLILQKTKPVYPPIAIAAHVQGTVILAANISKGGAIENLRVVSGPAMLQQSAVNAVSTWHYRPYLLDGQPVEVETTVNVVFTLGR
jgi:periplasmic protein TonB